MFNLLPEEQKKIIYKEYRQRLLIPISFFLGICGMVVFFVLSPSLFVVNLKHASLVEKQTKLESENPELLNIKELESEIEKQKAKIDVINSSKGTEPVEIIEKILASITSKISIDSISLEVKESNVRVSLQGHSSDRESLLNFSRKIEQEKIFSEVNLPVSDLAKESDIDFSMSFVKEIKHEEKN